MDNSYTQRIQEVLQKNEQIGIVVGKNPTIDDMASGLALYLGLKAAQKNVSIASPTEPIVEVSSLVGINKVSTTLSGEGGDLVVTFPYKDREIEKVSYSLENGYLNIIVKAGEDGLSFTEKDVQYKRGGGGLPTLLFIVGTPRLSDLGGLFNPDALKDTTVVNIDNKADNQGFGDIVVVSPRSSSVSELMANLLEDLALPIDVDIAQNLLLGISFSTDNFQDSKTSATAFEMAAMLMKKGAMRVAGNKTRHDSLVSNSSQNQHDPIVNRKNDQRNQFFGENKQNNFINANYFNLV